MLRRTVLALVALSATLVSTSAVEAETTAVPDTETRPDSDVHSVGPPLESASEQVRAASSTDGYARFSIDGSFVGASLVPGTRVVVAIDDDNDKIVRYDFDTNDIESGASVSVSSDTRTFLSGDSRWFYAVESDDVDPDVLSFSRYSVEELTLDLEFTIDTGVKGIVALRTPIVTPVPGTSDRIAFLGEGQIGVIEDGVVLADTAPSPGSPNLEYFNLVAFDEGSVFTVGVRGNLITFDVTATGVTPADTVVESSGTDLRRIGDELLFADRVYDAADPATSRPATEFDRAVPDPERDVRYGSAIFDEATGAVLPPGRPCPVDGVVLGDGWTLSSDLSFENVLDRCGSYGDFTPVQPARVFDSRPASGFPGSDDPILAGEERRIRVHGLGGVPEDGVESVVLNVTAIRQRGAGDATNYLTVWPAGFDRPTVANMNLADGATVGNMVTVSTAAGGFVDVYSDVGTVDLTVDVLGYFTSAIAPAGARFYGFDPFRPYDSRLVGRRLGPGEAVTLDLLQDSSLLRRLSPDGRGFDIADVVGAVMAVTAIQPDDKGFFQIFPSGAPLPTASSMNFPPGTNTNRLVTVELDDGEVDIVNSDTSTHLTVDLVGIYVRGVPMDQNGKTLQNGRFVGFVPYRDIDTRADSPFDGDGRIPAATLLFTEGYQSGITLATNLTAIRPSALGFFSAGGYSGDRSFAVLRRSASLNFGPGAIIANQVLLSPSDDIGGIAIYNETGDAHFTLDVFGYYTGP